MRRCVGITVKKGWSRVCARTRTFKNPTKCLWPWEPDRRSNFFFSPPAHLCAVTYMTEISLIMTLNNQFTLPYLTLPKTINNRKLLPCISESPLYFCYDYFLCLHGLTDKFENISDFHLRLYKLIGKF